MTSPPPPPPPPPPPRVLGRYEVLRWLATGGTAAVYLARADDGTPVALKYYHPHLQTDDEFRAMFLDEARLAAALSHPNVVPVLDAAGPGEPLYLVMPYIEGARLSDLITHEHALARARGATAGPAGLPVDLVARVMLDVLAGVHAAHELRGPDGALRNLVHRDVTPQNVLVGADGAARLLDFGIAKAEARAAVTREGQVKGKLGYMPPEQLERGAVSRQTDVYAAGVVLWEALTGVRLFHEPTEAATLREVLAGRVPPPSELGPAVPPALDAVVLRALAREPAARHASAEELARELARAAPAASAAAVAARVAACAGREITARRAGLGAATVARLARLFARR